MRSQHTHDFTDSSGVTGHYCNGRTKQFVTWLHQNRFMKHHRGDGCLNDLILLKIDKDSPLDYAASIDVSAAKYPRRMQLVNPLLEP